MSNQSSSIVNTRPDIDPDVKEDQVLIECEHLAAVSGPNGTEQMVIFEPTRDTQKRVQEWKESNEFLEVLSIDRAGRYVSYDKMRVIEKRYDYGTLVVQAMPESETIEN